ncbi:MAG TPA: phosphotransferase [Solirubrobacteraceae bacterium]
MTRAHGTTIWASEAWLAQATAWADERLAEHGLERTRPPEQVSLRPWATVLRIPTTDELVWLKAAAPRVAFEVGLYELLGRVAPERVLTPLATDVGRAWLLLPDGGPTLGDRLRGRALVEAFAQALPKYAQLQRDLAPHADELLARGVQDMRPARTADRFDEALAYVHALADARERVELERVAAMRPAVLAWAERLAASAVPPSVDHNDLHPWNVLAGARFYDWGDAVLAHPFATMRALGWIPLEPGDIVRLRDAYLAGFADLAPHAELVEELELACRVGNVARALTWQRSVADAAPGEVKDRWLTGASEALFSLLDDTWLGRA